LVLGLAAVAGVGPGCGEGADITRRVTSQGAAEQRHVRLVISGGYDWTQPPRNVRVA
jgi:hypothetical protein